MGTCQNRALGLMLPWGRPSFFVVCPAANQSVSDLFGARHRTSLPPFEKGWSRI